MRKRFLGSMFLSALIYPFLLAPVASAQAIPVINTWWPVDSVHVSGIQPFKVALTDMSVDTYAMTWSVDGGALNPMTTNMTDAPHKEATVDVRSWNWQSSGHYAVTFHATDLNGRLIAEKTITLWVDSSGAPVSSSSISSASSLSSSSISSVSSASSLSSSSISSVPSSSSVSSATLHVWWPSDGASIQGVQPFKMALQDGALGNYAGTWSVDGGSENPLFDNTQDAPHKEASVDVSNWKWNANGRYVITFRAKNANGALLAQQSVTIYTGITTAPVSSVSSASSKSVGNVNNLIGATGLYVSPTSPAQTQVNQWLNNRPQDAAMMQKIARQPVAQWLGAWNQNVHDDVVKTMNAAAAQNVAAVFTLYNIPQRDCGGYSAGGMQSVEAYATWVQSIASAIGNGKAIVIVEPDALAQMSCLSDTDQQRRMQILQDAVRTLKAQNHTSVYLDAGHPNWISAADMSAKLQRAGVSNADGFSLNVSNFESDDANASYGSQISSLTNGKHFVVDTSRNGAGATADHAWCNPSGRALGRAPTTVTGQPLIDAYLWIKSPGESDGSCNGGPSAGQWWADYALGLAQRASW